MSVRHLNNTSAVKWLPPHDEMLRKLHDEGRSSSQVAASINKEFSTDYSRNAVIGRKHRLGIRETMKRKPKPAKPRVFAKKPPPAPVQPKPDHEAVVLRCIEIEPRMVRFLDLEPGDCKYPYGDSDFRFCGHRAEEGRAYCWGHLELSRGPAH